MRKANMSREETEIKLYRKREKWIRWKNVARSIPE